jgi:hypothetical protein
MGSVHACLLHVWGCFNSFLWQQARIYPGGGGGSRYSARPVIGELSVVV